MNSLEDRRRRPWLKPLAVALLGGSLSTLTIVSCGQHTDVERAAADAMHQPPREPCMDLPSIYPLQRIRSGGYFDYRLHTRLTAEDRQAEPMAGTQCPVDTRSLDFYWTGTYWIPGGYRKQEDLGKDWKWMQVTVVFSDQKRQLECQVNPTNERCRSNTFEPSMAKQHPAEFVVKPLRYPNLEIWIPPSGYRKGSNSLDFVIADFPKPDGSPRHAACMLDFDLEQASRDQLINIDLDSGFGQICTIYLHEFDFKAGAGQVRFPSKILWQIGAHLRWLQSYIDKSIIEEH